MLAFLPTSFTKVVSLVKRAPRGATPTDANLLERVRCQDDSAAWQQFVEQYEPVLMAYVRRRGLKEDDARDVVQEVFIKLHRALPEFDFDPTRGRFRTWLWQVTFRAAADWVRQQERRARAEGEWRQRHAPPPIERARPEASLLEADRKEVLKKAMLRVRLQSQAKSWACFEQYTLLHRPTAEVAAELGLTPNAVYVTAGRVLARVRAEATALEGRGSSFCVA